MSPFHYVQIAKVESQTKEQARFLNIDARNVGKNLMKQFINQLMSLLLIFLIMKNQLNFEINAL